jgi:hypothetical protein
MAMSERIRLFANGFEYDCWQEANCDGCILYDPDEPPTCDLDAAIGEAMFTDGKVPAEIAARMGWTPECRAILGWSCKERLTEPRPAAVERIRAGAAMLPGFDAGAANGAPT